MGTLNSGNNALRAGEIFKGVHRLFIGNGNVFGSAGIVKPCMLRTDAGIVKPCGDGVHGSDLTVFVLAEVGLHTVENAEPSGVDGSGGFKGVNAPARCLTSDQFHIFILNEMIKSTDGVGAASYTGHDHIRKSSFHFQHLALYLF